MDFGREYDLEDAGIDAFDFSLMEEDERNKTLPMMQTLQQRNCDHLKIRNYESIFKQTQMEKATMISLR